jgi:23S rRNA (uracil1939-C5)-methyltransferase
LLVGARGKGEAVLSLGRRSPVIDLRWSGEPLPSQVYARFEAAVHEGSLAGARVFDGAVTRPAVIGDPTPWIIGADGAPLRLAPGGFSQASETMNRGLVTRIAELAGELAGEGSKILELYSGAGNLTVALARKHQVVAVESDNIACEAARANLAERNLTARIVEADAATELQRMRRLDAKLVVLDPPRTGAKDVTRMLGERRPPAVIYVSCDPPTLARDVKALGLLGYSIHTLETFEMFPQTSHVECVVGLVHLHSRANEGSGRRSGPRPELGGDTGGER